MNPLELSIIVPFFNAGSFLKRTLNAVKQQEGVNYELIVVDDGSDNFNSQELQKYGDKIDLIITQENKGQAAARNTGIKHARGTYILNWDADDYFEPSFCVKAIQIFETDADVKLVTCEALRTLDGLNGDHISPQGGGYTNFLFENAALGSAMFKREDWNKIGGYDEAQEIRGFEDWEFYLRLLYPNGKAVIIPERLFTYIRHSESTTSQIHNLKLDKRKFIYKKNEDIYKENYQLVISDLFKRLKREEFEKNKNLQRLEFRLGTLILKPLRLLKNAFK